MAKSQSLTEKNKLFCKALFKFKWNQRKAYQEVYADCKDAAADASASVILSNPKARAYLQVLAKKYEKSELITVTEIVDDIKEVLSRCMQKEAVMEYDYADKKMVPTGEWEFKERGALKALELLGKYKSMFTDKLALTGKDGEPLPSISVNLPSGLFKKEK